MSPNIHHDPSSAPPARSGSLLARSRASTPGGIHSCRRETTPAVCVSSTKGARITTVDGTELIDYHGAYGCIVLGHCYPAVVERVIEAAQTRSIVGVGTSDIEVELAEALVRHVPSVEQASFTNSGGEATYSAIRLARGATGREKVLKFQGHYHGSHDYVLPNALTLPGAPPTDPDASAGLLPAAVASVLVARYNDLDSVRELFASHPSEIAAIIVEPILHNAATIPPAPGFLEGLRDLCTREGTVLIFDEVISGFRHSLGGYQALCGVVPDLTTFAKAMGNGFPIGAIGGRRELMEHFNTAPAGNVFYSGTYNGNSATVAAALATIGVLESENVHKHTFALGERMRNGLRDLVLEREAPATVVGFGSIYGLIFATGPLQTYEDVQHNDPGLFLAYKAGLIERGVLEMPAVNAMRSHISYSHTEADVDATLAASAEALDAALEQAGTR